MFNGEMCKKAGVDLILFDLQENLPVPGVSIPANQVPEWNSDKEFKEIELAIVFATKHLQDNGCVVIFHSWSAKARGVVVGLTQMYPFLKFKEWLGINRMHLTSGLNPANTV
jgi:hypothetical protein